MGRLIFVSVFPLLVILGSTCATEGEPGLRPRSRVRSSTAYPFQPLPFPLPIIAVVAVIVVAVIVIAVIVVAVIGIYEGTGY